MALRCPLTMSVHTRIINMAVRCLATMSVNTKHPLIDDVITITAKGLPSQEMVTIGAKCRLKNLTFLSFAHFKTDSFGELNLSVNPSLGGTYEGVDPMGLFWSLIPTTGQNIYHRMIKLDVTTPYDFTVRIWDEVLGVDDFDDDGDPKEKGGGTGRRGLMCETKIERWYMDEGVDRIEVREGRLKGTLFLPRQVTIDRLQRPAILDLFGNAGGLVEYRAAMLASRGFVTLALAYMGYEGLPSFPKQLDLEYFEEAVHYLSDHKVVVKGKVGLLGLSKGANISVALASYTNSIKCAVIQGTHNKNLYTDYLYKGSVYPAVNPDVKSALNPEGILVLRPVQEAVSNEEQYINPIERATDTQFLFIHGSDDQVCDVTNQLKMIHRLKEHKLDNFESHIYPGTGHMIEPPYRAVCNDAYHPGFKAPILYGGQPATQAKAQKEIWRLILDFFKRQLDS